MVLTYILSCCRSNKLHFYIYVSKLYICSTRHRLVFFFTFCPFNFFLGNFFIRFILCLYRRKNPILFKFPTFLSHLPLPRKKVRQFGSTNAMNKSKRVTNLEKTFFFSFVRRNGMQKTIYLKTIASFTACVHVWIGMVCVLFYTYINNLRIGNDQSQNKCKMKNRWYFIYFISLQINISFCLVVLFLSALLLHFPLIFWKTENGYKLFELLKLFWMKMK